MTWPEGSERPAGLLLDVDGTLVDTEPLHRSLFRAYFAERGWPADERTLRLFTGRRADDVFAAHDGPWRGEDPAALFADVIARIPLDARPDAVPGASALVRTAHARGVRVAVVTSATAAWVEACLGGVLGVLDLLDAVVTRDEVTAGKPHPEGYLLGARLLGLESARCWAFEDSPDGVRAAVAAGVGRVVGVTTSVPASSLAAAGAHDTVRDLVGVLPGTVHS